MTARRGLGRGLDALLASSARPLPPGDSDDVVFAEIAVDAIAPNPEQPRADIDQAALDELAQSIRVHGVLQPLVVERDGHAGFRLVAGERRLRAARLGGLATVPAVIRPATESARHALELALVENLQRADLSPLDEAAAYARLGDAFGLSHEAVGDRVGKSRSTIANAVRLLALAPEVQQALRERRLSAGHARALLGLPLAEEQVALARRTEEEHLSVREVERAVQARIAAPSGAATASPSPPGDSSRTSGATARASPAPADAAVTAALEEALGTPVRLERRRHGGRLVIDFYDDDQLDDLYTRLGGRPL